MALNGGGPDERQLDGLPGVASFELGSQVGTLFWG